MKMHVWVEDEQVYDAFWAFVCKGCGARILSERDLPTHDDLRDAGLPLDCDEAAIVVSHEDYHGC